MENSALVLIITAVIASLPGIIALIAQRKKTQADTESTISKAALELLKPYEAEVKKLRVEVSRLEKEYEAVSKKKEELDKRLDSLAFENGNLKEWAEKLCCQVQEMGGVPVKFEEKTRPR